MAAHLGKVLARCSLGPLNYAGSLIMANRVADALNELAPANLYGGFLRGVDETAKLAGLSRGDVEGALPRNDIRAAVESLAGSHTAALAAWNLYAGRIGGLLAGIADLTVDGRAPDVPLCLERLASKVSRDKEFAAPLRALAGDVDRWQELVQKCHDLLESGGAIHSAYQRRRLRMIAIGISSVLALSVAAIFGLRIRAAHARVEEKLTVCEAPNAMCAAFELSDDELAHGTSAQRSRAADMRNACTARRKKEAEAAAERDRVAAVALAEAARKQAHESACAALAEHATADTLVDADAEAAGASLALLKRAAHGELDLADLGPASPTFPCGDTPAQKRLQLAFANAVLRSPWPRYDDLSDAARAALAAHALEISLPQRVAFAKHADVVAQRAVLGGDVQLLRRAAKLCALAADLGFAPRAYCPGAIKLAGSAGP